MSQRVLSPQQFFHGTPHKLKPGQMLTPGGGATNFAQSTGKHVYFSDNPTDAAQWADIATEESGNPKARSRVYRVQPTGKYEQDRGAEIEGSYRTRHPVKVLGEHRG